MRDRKLIVGLLAAVLFAGGCIMEPLEEPEEEAVGAVTAGVSTAPPPAPGDTAASPATVLDSVRKSVGTDVSDPNKPQPDPWNPVRKPESSATSPTP